MLKIETNYVIVKKRNSEQNFWLPCAWKKYIGILTVTAVIKWHKPEDIRICLYFIDIT
jgi:hypothetical protein